ncbi:hypothetical protein NDU88_005661 [Pleurodeles waltl]|uniref:Uncharacterized protein n=1 Tax=Pleurodeles waltl TaxID=8319 RepID=A0AAV7WVV5_PLEWA|nr:hypothetical protein NDU88_005661 [Pleurodeles waltl]
MEVDGPLTRGSALRNLRVHHNSVARRALKICDSASRRALAYRRASVLALKCVMVTPGRDYVSGLDQLPSISRAGSQPCPRPLQSFPKMAAARLSTSRGGAERETAADDRNTAHAHRRSLRCDPRDYQHSQDSDANLVGAELASESWECW